MKNELKKIKDESPRRVTAFFRPNRLSNKICLKTVEGKIL